MADTTKLIIELEVLLRNLNRTLRGLDQVKKRLDAISRFGFGQGNAATNLNRQSLAVQRLALAQQRLQLQQQRLSVQSQELANRQERARQASDRLALSAQRLTQAQQRAANTTGRQADAHVRAFKAIQRGLTDANNHVRFFRANESALAKAPQLDAHVRAFRSLQRGIADADAHVRFFRANEAALKRAPQLDAHVRAFRAIEESTRRATKESERLARQRTGLQDFERALNSLGGALLRVGGGLRSLGLTASVALTGPLAALATFATRNAVEFDSLRRGLTVMAGSAEEAGRQLERLKEIAKAPGIGFQEAIQGSIRLQAVGFSAEQAEKALVQFANAVALTGGGRDELERITVQLGQLAAKGKVVAQDLKPIIEAGPAVGQALLEAFGTVNSEDIQKLGLSTDEFFEKLIKALSNLPRAAAGAKNAFENFSDSMFRSSLALGDAILPVLTKITEFLEPIVQRLSEGFRSLPQSVQVAIVAIGALAAALGPVLFLAGGVISGLGALATALAALLPILGSIGLPAILAILGGLATVVAEITVVITALGLAWRSNFLGIRQIVTNAANAVLTAFNRIRAVFDEAIRRILPTLQSITTKVLGAVQAVWERYGKVVVQVVGDAFRFVTDVTITFLKLFTDFVDLVLKLIDGDWQGAWRAFARIIITQLDRIGPLIVRFERGVRRALLSLTVFIIRQAIAFADAGSRLAVSFITALAVGLIAGFPKIQNALATVLLLAAVGIPLGPIAQALIARLIAELRKAAGEDVEITAPTITAPGETPTTPRRRRTPTPSDAEDDKTLRRQLDQLREARDKFAEVQEESQIDLLRSRIESEFEATKAGLDRELTVLEQNFDDRLVALRKYLTERKSLEESQIDAEIAKELELTSVLFQELNARSRAAVREFETERAEIDRDPKLKGAARQAAIETAEIKKATELQKAQAEFRVKNAESIARVVQLEKDRRTVGEDLVRIERLLTEEIAKQQAQIGFDLLEEQGRTADAEAGRLKTRFTETLRDLRVDISGLGEDLQKALNGVDLTTLQQRLDDLPQPIRTIVELLDIGIKRAQILEAQRLVDDLSTGLRLDEERIQNRVLDGLLNQRQAQAAILLVQQEYRGVLLDVLRGELAKAEVIKDQGLITAIRGQIAEVERLGVEIDEVGQQINQALFRDLQSGLSGIFSGARKGFEGLKEAAISFGERLLDTLNDIAATSILQKIEGIFKPDATNTKGTVGGFFAKLFGQGPDKSQAAATAAATTLQTGATTAATTFTTGTATASAAFSTSVVTAATSFASAVIAAGAAFAAAVGAAGIAQGAGGGLGELLGGTAATGLYPAVPGGVYKVVEGGYPEAVLTTDPRHASRQMEILRAYLAETRGLYGRIKGFAAGAIITPDITSGISRAPMPQLNVGELAVTHAPSMMRLRQILVDERDIGNWVNSPEGERVMVDFLNKNQPVIRKLSGK